MIPTREKITEEKCKYIEYLKNKLDDLVKQHEICSEDLTRISRCLQTVKHELVRETWNIREEETIVVSTRTREEFLLSTIDMGLGRSYRKKPWIKGFSRKKDGTFSKVENNLYDDWEVKK